MSASPNLSAYRRKARHYGLQALYQWQLAGASLNDIEAEFRADNDMTHVDVDYFHAIVHEIPSRISTLDEVLEPCIDRKMTELDPVSLALLRMAIWEFTDRIDVPYKVVINEAVALAKKFGPTDSYKYINGVLDRLAKELRALEVDNES
jgi:N utilization substance protein B